MQSVKQRALSEGGRKILWLIAGLALAMIGAALYPALAANLQRVELLRRLDLTQATQSMDEQAWDAGWRSLCAANTPAAAQEVETKNPALLFAAMASIDRGDYAAALAQFQHLANQDTADASNASAYVAALKMDWTGAARAYRPEQTARHRRFWGTIFYLAAQQLMFTNRHEEAARFYRQADAAYSVRGPYRGLALADCLEQRERPLEAFDAQRRALVTLPIAEAAEYLSHFNRLRVEGLRTWHALDPGNTEVAHWLTLYEADAAAQSEAEVGGELLPGRPDPRVRLDLDLGGGRRLIGFDYRPEDIQTGPFMAVDFYLNLNDNGFIRVRRNVVNQAPNGAFGWDWVPAGVRPFGWHTLVYSPDMAALYPESPSPGESRMCLDAARIGSSFGLQGDTMPLSATTETYIQGGATLLEGADGLSLGRTWFGTQDTHPYSYVEGGHEQGIVRELAGTWQAPTGATSLAVWLLSHGSSKACFGSLYLLAVPPLVD